MKYCELCGSECSSTGNKSECKSCGGIFYVNPRGATALLLFDKRGKLVLGRRAINPSVNKLDCIGGFVDVGENFEQGMLRELHEESGLVADDITDLEYLGSTYDDYEWQDRKVPVVSVYFTATLRTDKKLVASDDIGSFESIDIGNIVREDVAWDGMWKMLKLLKDRS